MHRATRPVAHPDRPCASRLERRSRVQVLADEGTGAWGRIWWGSTTIGVLTAHGGRIPSSWPSISGGSHKVRNHPQSGKNRETAHGMGTTLRTTASTSP